MSSLRTPAAPGVPVLGSLVDLRRDALQAYLRACRDRGDVVRFVAGPPGLRVAFHAIFSASGAAQVLSAGAPFHKGGHLYREVRAVIGDGLLTSDGGDHVRQRRLVQPLFTRRRVDGYAEGIRDETTRTLDGWRGRDGEVVDIAGEMTDLTLRVVTRLLFGADGSAAVPTIQRCFPVLNSWTYRRGTSPVRTPREWPTPANRRAASARAELYALCDRIIADRASAGADGADLLSRLIRTRDEDGDRLSPSEVRDQVLLFLLAGHETTATALSFSLHLLATHPEEQRRTRDEVDRVLGGREPLPADLPDLDHTTRVVKEALRLYPSAPVIARSAREDTEIDGHRIPAGTEVALMPWVTHRHPAYWSEPERFDPDRFLPEREATRPRYAWYPFGGGPRACIGQHFSMLETVLVLSMLTHAYRFEAVDRTVPVGQGVTLTPLGPNRCRLVAR
ncbi:cytochrome P450 [Actinoalloteichus caeruleus]|uniref:cytochrome P450 n=1 Tax=Actinoalloteichus cyanogriseus TaxID=2893586 RepID=UPI0004AA5DB9|nr:cytochrome P450 [Actinoalloteichus caeruleus]